MLTSREDTDAILLDQLEPVLNWLAHGGDAWSMDLDYWRRRDVDRRNQMRHDALEITGRFDIALDFFRPADHPDRTPDSIGEAQMREEVVDAMADLRRLGYLGGPSASRDIRRR
jgi:hypothetical protein